jgi:hypothetical protein
MDAAQDAVQAPASETVPTWAGWVRKKPSPHANTPWQRASTNANIQKRWLVTHGHLVSYYASPAPLARRRPNGSFDLRQATLLKPANEIDPTAPEFSIEVIVAKHHIVIDFEQREAHDACLEIWANAAPRDAMPEGWVIGQSSKNPQMRTRIDSLSKQQAALPVQPEEQLAVLAEADDDADDDDVTAEVTYSAVGDDDADLNSKASSFNVRVNSNSFDVL